MVRKKQVSEPVPVQVYLSSSEKARLDSLAEQLETSKSDILRKGIRAVERELTDPAAHPALRLIGLVPEGKADAVDAAREHDRVLAEQEEKSWAPSVKRQVRKSKRDRRGS
ncbi:MAG: ribbon-helix-helix protein, CopG family [Gemmatimonadota bacterium]|nr:ribbon-helix-helix protein, CopG family [Gemmatimonadota bacterium]